MPRASLCDVNVLLALVHERHAHSAHAVAWLDSVAVSGSILVCRVAQLGLLRLLTSPRILADDVMTPAEAWEIWQTMLSDDRFVLAEEPAALEPTWANVCRTLQPGAAIGTDVYLAAFAIATGHEIVTFDSGFRRFVGLRFRLLPS